jgi:hypothetical protein
MSHARDFIYKYECPCCGKLTTYPQGHFVRLHQGPVPTSFKSFKFFNHPKKVDDPPIEVLAKKRSRPTVEAREKKHQFKVHVGEFMVSELVLNPLWTEDNDELFFANPY